MKKSPLIWISVAVACLILLASFTNVVGVQTVESSKKNVINNVVDQKELLFQTILDIANNKEIQRLLLNSEMKGSTKRFFNLDMRFSVFVPHVLTKKYLNLAYNVGLILSSTLRASKIHSLLERYQLNNQEMQNEIYAVIEKNDELNLEIGQLKDLPCDCENDNPTSWNFPVLCLLLTPLALLAVFLIINNIGDFILQIISFIGLTLNCFWT